MADYFSNPTRTALHHTSLPDGPLTERQRALCDAVRHCSNLADFTAVPSRSEIIITLPSVACGMAPEVAERTLRVGIARARAEIDQIEAELNAYGPAPFMPQPYGVPTDGVTRETRHDVLVAVLRRVGDDLLTRVGDTPVERDPRDGEYRLKTAIHSAADDL